MKKKTVALLLALALVAGGAVGGTLAWLTSQSGTVTNTFVAGDIGTLTLEETYDGSVLDEDKNFLIVPGVTIRKDPVVTYTPAEEVKNGNDTGVMNVNAYVYVEVTPGTDEWVKNGALGYQSDFLSWSMDDAVWTCLDAEKYPHIFYKLIEVDGETKNDAATELNVIKDQSITVSEEIEVDDVEGKTTDTVNPGQITFKAYAIQAEGMEDAVDAWETIFPPTTP